VRLKIETYIIICFNFENFIEKLINIQFKVDFAMEGTFKVIVQIIMIINFLLLAKLKNMLITLDHHKLKYHNT
jgi:hypothetical protein